ncbi:MAG: hypothetical protein KH413_08850 [Actinomyces sp.]|nr:hypothetical protein [Actinomyces sp.]
MRRAASKTGAVPVGTKKLAQQAQKRRILGVLSVQGELFRAHTHHQATQGELFAHKAQQHGGIETNNTTAHPQQGSFETGITSAPENCTKNTHFAPAKATTVSVKARPAPAKATTVSIPDGYKRAKATPVSGERAAWSTGPICDTRGRWRGLAGRPVGGRRYKRRQTNTI